MTGALHEVSEGLESGRIRPELPSDAQGIDSRPAWQIAFGIDGGTGDWWLTGRDGDEPERHRPVRPAPGKGSASPVDSRTCVQESPLRHGTERVEQVRALSKRARAGDEKAAESLSNVLAELPVGALWGVGPATTAKLERLGLRWVRDLRAVDEATLAAHLGPSMAATLVAYARGDDRREVVVDRSAKSVGHDQTFSRSLRSLDEVRGVLRGHAGVVSRALRSHGQLARTVSLVVRFDDLTSVSRSQTLSFGVDDDVAIEAIAVALAESIDLRQSIRFVGLYASSFVERSNVELQLSFAFDVASDDALARASAISRSRQAGFESLRDAIDDVRQRFGRSALGSVADLGNGGVSVAVQRGRHAFGPGSDDS